MDNLSKKSNNHQQKRRIWQWIVIFTVLLSLISGSVLLYQWWQVKQNAVKIQEREQILTQLEAQAVQQYQNQQKQLPQVLI